MKYAIVVFRARVQTMSFYNILRSYGVFCSLIETPSSVQANCGMSIKIAPSSINSAKEIIARRYFDSFSGIFLIWQQDGQEKAQKIY